VKIIQCAYKTELDPNYKERKQIEKSADAAKWAYNMGLEICQKYYNEVGVGLSYAKLNKLLTTWKQHPNNQWLYDVSTYCCQSALKDLSTSYKNFYEGNAKLPIFKSKYSKKSFRLYRVKVERKNINLPKIGKVRLKEYNYLPIDTKIVSATISEQGGRWFVSLQVDEEVPEVVAIGPSIGIDLGINNLVTVSDGRVWKKPNALERTQRNLARKQKKLARQQKGSNRMKKNKRNIAKIHRIIANIRKNNLHEITSELVGVDKPDSERPAMIAIEDLQVKKMLSKKHLNKQISDAAWREFRRQLEYKCERWGVRLIFVHPQYTSQICNKCGYIDEKNRKREKFSCLECGYTIDADLNAAMNILDRAKTKKEYK
jgi:putative transposase